MKIFKQFEIEAAKRFAIVESIPPVCIGHDLRRKLHQKTKQFILHSRDFNMNRVKQNYLSLDQMIDYVQRNNEQENSESLSKKSSHESLHNTHMSSASPNHSKNNSV